MSSSASYAACAKDYVLERAWGDQGESFRFRGSTDLNLPAERRRDHFDDTNINRGETFLRPIINLSVTNLIYKHIALVETQILQCIR